MKSISKLDLANYMADDDSLDSTFLRMLIEHPSKVTVEIPQNCQYRIDLLAKKFYGNSKMYWVFEIMNSIMSVEELTAGRRLKTVTAQDFERLYTRWRHLNGRR